MEVKNVYIYRLIHVDNLKTILTQGTLFSKNSAPKGSSYIDISKESLHNDRANKHIPIAPQLTLHDCVPFYFGALTPMLYWNYRNKDQTKIIYLVADARRVIGSGCRFVFTDGHAYMEASLWYDCPDDLNKLHWDAIESRYWGPKQDPTGEQKRKKQAEFLVFHKLGWSEIFGIAVISECMKQVVEDVLRCFPEEKRRKVLVKPEWYF